MDQVLSIHDLGVTYGGVRAVRSVSLEVAAGESVAVLGANGAGKTSLLRAVSGLVPHTGDVVVRGHSTVGRRPEDIARLGLAHVPDNRGIFDDLTVADNLTTALYGVGRHRDRDAATAIDEVYDLFPILAERRDQAAGTMSGGQQQMLTIARALVQRPTVVLIDEMSMGLAPSIVQELFETVGRLTERGLGVVLVEQFVDQALSVVDRAVVMAGGRVVAAGTARELADSDVAAHYLGGEEAGLGAEVSPTRLPPSASVGVPLDARELRALRAAADAQGRTPEELVADLVRGRAPWSTSTMEDA